MLVVTTPTGQIGRQTLHDVLAAGEEPVRVIARDAAGLDPRTRDRVTVIEGTHQDPGVLDRALAGADALLVLVPPGRAGGENTRDRYMSFARPIAASLREHGVGHVVGISSAGRGWGAGAGVLSAAFAMDAELETTGAAYRGLGMPWFNENLLGQVGSIQESGTFTMAYAGDRVLPCVAVRDIADTAAKLLLDRTWAGCENVPVFGPDHLTPNQMAEVMSQAVDRPITYREISVADIASGALANGMPKPFVNDLTAMIQAQRDGIYESDHDRATPTDTTFRVWCEQVLRPMLVGSGR